MFLLKEPETNQAYLDKNGVAIHTVISMDENRLKVSSTPTLILVHSDGKIAGIWVGKLNSSRENDVLTAISGI